MDGRMNPNEEVYRRLCLLRLYKQATQLLLFLHILACVLHEVVHVCMPAGLGERALMHARLSERSGVGTWAFLSSHTTALMQTPFISGQFNTALMGCFGGVKKELLTLCHFIATCRSCEEEEGQGNDEGTLRGGWEQPQWFFLTLLLLLSPPPVLLIPRGALMGSANYNDQDFGQRIK